MHEVVRPVQAMHKKKGKGKPKPDGTRCGKGKVCDSGTFGYKSTSLCVRQHVLPDQCT